MHDDAVNVERNGAEQNIFLHHLMIQIQSRYICTKHLLAK
jgi:hypothetical protein